jgi:hypothetical protein
LFNGHFLIVPECREAPWFRGNACACSILEDRCCALSQTAILAWQKGSTLGFMFSLFSVIHFRRPPIFICPSSGLGTSVAAIWRPPKQFVAVVCLQTVRSSPVAWRPVESHRKAVEDTVKTIRHCPDHLAVPMTASCAGLPLCENAWIGAFLITRPGILCQVTVWLTWARLISTHDYGLAFLSRNFVHRDALVNW